MRNPERISNRVFPAAVSTALLMLVAWSARAVEQLPATDALLDTRPLAMGGTGMAAAASNPSIYTNPAGIMALKLYHVEVMYQYASEISSSLGGASVVDSVTSPFVGAGLGFIYKGAASSVDHSQFDVRLALAGAFTDFFQLGVMGKYLYVDQGGHGPNGDPALNSTGEAELNTFSMDAGLILKPVKFLSIGVGGQNLTDTGSQFAPIRLVPGIALHIADMLITEFDFVTDFTSHSNITFEYRGGVEVFIANVVPIRAGYYYKPWDETHHVTAGLGYVARDFGLEFGLSQGVWGIKDTTVGFAVRIFIN